MSSKKTSPTPDDLFRSIPPAEQFHAFPPLDAFPAETIAFLTGRREIPAASPALPQPVDPDISQPAADGRAAAASRPVNRPDFKPDSTSVSQPESRTADQSASQKDARSASHNVNLSASYSEYPSHNHPLDQTSNPSQGHSLNPSSSHTKTASPSMIAQESAAEGKRNVRLKASSIPQRHEAVPPGPRASETPNQAPARAFFPDTSGHGPEVSGKTETRSPRSEKSAALARIAASPPAWTTLSGSLSDPGPAARLNANQRRVLLFLLDTRPYIVTFAQIAASTGMGEASARTILRRLAGLDFLTFKKARDGNLQGIRMAFNQELCQAFRQSLESAQTSHSVNQSQSHIPNHSFSQSQNQSLSQPVFKPDTQPADLQPLFKKEGKESILPDEKDREEQKEFAGWSDEFLTWVWPLTHQAGFRMEHLQRVAVMRQTLGKPLERDMVRLSLDRCEWELEKFGHLNELTSGEKVRNTQAYLFTALIRWGILRPHPEYVSREEELMRQAAREIEQRKQAAKQLEDARFAVWRDGLSPAELDALMRGCPGGPRDIWLKNHWKKHVQPLAADRDAAGTQEAG